MEFQGKTWVKLTKWLSARASLSRVITYVARAWLLRRACSPVNRRARWLAGNPRLDWSSACTKMPTNWSGSSLFKREELLQLVGIFVHAVLQSKRGWAASHLARLLTGEQALREVTRERHTKWHARTTPRHFIILLVLSMFSLEIRSSYQLLTCSKAFNLASSRRNLVQLKQAVETEALQLMAWCKWKSW